MNIYCGRRSSRGVPIALQIAMGHGLFSDPYALDVPITRCILRSDGYPVRLCRPHLREAPADFGLARLVTTFLNDPSYLA